MSITSNLSVVFVQCLGNPVKDSPSDCSCQRRPTLAQKERFGFIMNFLVFLLGFGARFHSVIKGILEVV